MGGQIKKEKKICSIFVVEGIDFMLLQETKVGLVDYSLFISLIKCWLQKGI